ncbi:MAG: hypothetical protein JWR33_2064 [Naasia sp.]|jgi:acetyltransferase-like isoleucine patch superfamily enzyme|uniref:CatB-related O-acetyltransferase n=1 Tax=Naasia sp. TaxID=2546198 RepID=UPI00260A6C11|nr:CatB-related O-acetyltransferase [Naasia sp.]MCU1571323.1 hypothetical protein [Naasia sp.]
MIDPPPPPAVGPAAAGFDLSGFTTRDLANVRLRGSARLDVEPPVFFLRRGTYKSHTRIGAFTYVNNGMVDKCVSIGRYCSIGRDLKLAEMNHPLDWLSTSVFQYQPDRFGWHESADSYETRSARGLFGGGTSIGNDVWIAAGVTIMRDVTIGDGAVIGAGAVVTKDVEPYTVVGGIPAKPIRVRFPPHVVERLLELRWWDYSPNQLSGAAFDDIEAAMDFVQGLREAGVEPYRPEVEVLTNETLGRG